MMTGIVHDDSSILTTFLNNCHVGQGLRLVTFLKTGCVGGNRDTCPLEKHLASTYPLLWQLY